MRNYSVDAYLEAGSFPELSLLCYSVSWESGTRRTLTRYSEGDILSDYIDIDSIHAEWAYDSSDIFQPGGVIPVCLSFRLLSGHSLSLFDTLQAAPSPQSAADYSYLFRPQIKLKRTGYIDYYYPFPYMILRQITRERNSFKSYKLYFEDESCVFDYYEYDVGSKFGYQWQLIVRNILNLTGQGGTNDLGISGTANITGTSYYQGDPMSARKVLSYIAQMNGVFMTRDNDSKLKMTLMLAAEEASSGGFPYVLDGEIPYNYILDAYSESTYPTTFTYRSVRVLPYNTNVSTRSPTQYCINNNPFIVEDNYRTYETLLTNRLIKQLSYSGLEIVCRFNPNYELGDYLKYLVLKNNALSGGPISIARIVWNGGAFCTVYGTRFGVDNR